MIVLKNLSREYNIEPARLRQLLRAEFELAPRGRRWRWNEDDKQDRNELKKVRKFLSSLSEDIGHSSK